MFSEADAFLSTIKGAGRRFHSADLGLKPIPCGSLSPFLYLSLCPAVIHFSLFVLLAELHADRTQRLKMFYLPFLTIFIIMLFFGESVWGGGWVAFTSHIGSAAFVIAWEFILLFFFLPPFPTHARTHSFCLACLFVNQSGENPAALLISSPPASVFISTHLSGSPHLPLEVGPARYLQWPSVPPASLKGLLFHAA